MRVPLIGHYRLRAMLFTFFIVWGRDLRATGLRRYRNHRRASQTGTGAFTSPTGSGFGREVSSRFASPARIAHPLD
jgi:hypothetical protein